MATMERSAAEVIKHLPQIWISECIVGQEERELLKCSGYAVEWRDRDIRKVEDATQGDDRRSC